MAQTPLLTNNLWQGLGELAPYMGHSAAVPTTAHKALAILLVWSSKEGKGRRKWEGSSRNRQQPQQEESRNTLPPQTPLFLVSLV